MYSIRQTLLMTGWHQLDPVTLTGFVRRRLHSRASTPINAFAGGGRAVPFLGTRTFPKRSGWHRSSKHGPAKRPPRRAVVLAATAVDLESLGVKLGRRHRNSDGTTRRTGTPAQTTSDNRKRPPSAPPLLSRLQRRSRHLNY